MYKKFYYNSTRNYFFRFVECASRYTCVMKTNLMHHVYSVYNVNQPLHASYIFVAHHQEVYCIYTTISTFCICTVYLL